MKKILVIGIVCALSLVGCRERNDPETIHINNANLNSPEFVGETTQGKLYRINVDLGFTRPPDRVYYFESNNTVTVNRTGSNGKTSATEASVFVNGKEYILKQ